MESVEVGLIGKEGFVGLPVVFGFKTSPLRVVIQADATGYRVDVATLRKLLPRCPQLEIQIQRFAMVLAMQSTQIAACNRLHDVVERLARWLIMSHDRIGGEANHALDAGVSGTNAWSAEGERQHCSRRPAKGRNDYVHARQRDDVIEQSKAGASGLRLLRHHSTAKSELAS